MRILAASDLHTDFRENWTLLERLSDSAHQDDVLIVAGDIADRLETIEETLSLLGRKFLRLFYVPGNHELWVRRGGQDSVRKLHEVLELCDRLGVETRPAQVGPAWVVPLFSWYDEGFDTEPSSHASELEGWADFYFCKWPWSIKSLPEFFLEMNEPVIKPYDGPIISFSHFLPRRELLPERDKLRLKQLPKVVGCTRLEEQIRRLGSAVHVFGHSHINYDRVLDEIRYVQNALSYPRERRGSDLFLKEVWTDVIA